MYCILEFIYILSLSEYIKIKKKYIFFSFSYFSAKYFYFTKVNISAKYQRYACVTLFQQFFSLEFHRVANAIATS